MILWTTKPPRKQAISLAVAGLLTICLSGAAHAQSPSSKGDAHVKRLLADPSSPGLSRVIAKLDGDLTEDQRAQLKRLHADVYQNRPIIRSVALSVPTRNLTRLASLPFVKHISTDMAVRKLDEFTVNSSGADAADTKYRLNGGSGVGVAVIDSGVGRTPLGIQTLPDLLLRTINGRNFVPNDRGAVDPADMNDACGHGSHVAGIIAGNGTCSTGVLFKRHFRGIATAANIINIRVLNSVGAGTVSQVVAGIQWAIQNRAARNIRVINLSIGHPVGESYQTDPLCQAVETAWKSGIVVVCAAGNSGRIQNVPGSDPDNEGYGSAYGSIQCPGNDPYVITVGAMKATDLAFNTNGTYTYTRSKDRVATYSSRGPSRVDLVLKPDIMAAGNKVISTTVTGSYLYNYAGGTNQIPWNTILPPLFILPASWQTELSYFRLSGTSMAAPVVAGAAALMLKNNPSLNPDTVKARLMVAADKWTQADGTANPLVFGAGYVNIPAALACTVTPTQPAMSPQLSIDADGNVTINMDRAVWGTDLTGTRAIWGMNGVSDLRAVWGTRAIWGSSDNLLSASRAIWGSTLMERAVWGTSVWEDRAIWGTNASAADLQLDSRTRRIRLICDNLELNAGRASISARPSR